MTDNRERVLVTGGAGYIGSHACKELWQSGYEPVVFDSLENGFAHNVKWGKLIKGDLRNYSDINNAISEIKPYAVIHFAAYAYVGESVLLPQKYYENNVVGSYNLLKAMTENSVSRLVFSSSCATYGIPDSKIITEKMPQSPVNPYGNTKLIMEKMMRDFSQATDLKFMALRYFNAAGASPDGEIGEEHDPETHLIPLILKVAAGELEFLTIFGEDYETYDGTCIRDYIHVSDLAQAHIGALKYLDKTSSPDKVTALNLGNGNGYSIKEVVASVERVTGKKIPCKIGNRRAGDPPILVGSSDLAKSVIEWKPRYTEIDTIVEHAWNFCLKAKFNN